MKSEELQNRTKQFAHRCVKLSMALPETVLGRHVRGQIVRCSTSVASNYRSALLAQTKAAFISKISIVIEEADESEFWLEFIMDEKLIERKRVLPLFNEAHELSSIFITTRKTAQRKKPINNQQSTINNRKKIGFPVIPSDREDDLHNLDFADSADLVLFVAGNQFMVMDELIRVFQEEYPDVKRIFYETLPPGLELKQILAGGALFRDSVIDVVPDVYASVTEKAMERLEKDRFITKGDYFLYLHNRIVLMVPEGNPAQIVSVADLGQEEVRISQPNPEYEDIAYYIIDMYRQAGGEGLVHRVMEEKRAEGTTILTVVHHRETPLRILKGTVDVGPVWATEVIHARQRNLSVDMVEPGEDLDQRDRINYYVCRLKNAAHSENAEKFLDFIKSARAQGIYEAYGFVPHFETSEP